MAQAGSCCCDKSASISATSEPLRFNAIDLLVARSRLIIGLVESHLTKIHLA